MEWALGSIEGKKGLFIVFGSAQGIVVVAPKELKSQLLNGGVAAVSHLLSNSDSVLELLDGLGIIDFDLGDMADSLAGGGLMGSIVGAAVEKVKDAAMKKAEDAVTGAVAGLLATVLAQASEADMMEALRAGRPVLSLSRDKIKSVRGKRTGIVSKLYELEVEEPGFWIFTTKHKMKFGSRQLEQGQRGHAALG